MTKNESQIQWSALDSLTLSVNTRADSDAFSFDANDIQAAIAVSADNQGAPASGDTLQVYLKQTTGDVLGDAGDDYETDEHALYLGTLDTYATNTPGEDPARKVFDIPTSAKGGKLSVVGAQAATRSIVVRARLITQRTA